MLWISVGRWHWSWVAWAARWIRAGEDTEGVARSGFPRTTARSGWRVWQVRLGMPGLLTRLDACRGRGAAVPEAIRLVARLHDVAVAREPVQQRGGHLRVAKHAGPFTDGQVGCDRQAGVLTPCSAKSTHAPAMPCRRSPLSSAGTSIALAGVGHQPERAGGAQLHLRHLHSVVDAPTTRPSSLQSNWGVPVWAVKLITKASRLQLNSCITLDEPSNKITIAPCSQGRPVGIF